jgi:hypothetical protein
LRKVKQGRTRNSCVQRGVKKGLAMDDLSLSEKPVYSTYKIDDFMPLVKALMDEKKERQPILAP